jgi:dTDP-4-dehydrorhamnose 3,5-epimerase
VTCVRGSVFDVVVDLRVTSDTFGQWWGYELTDKNGDSLAIPEGCAHGLQTLKDHVDLVYMHTEKYSPSAEAAINPFDSDLAIRWPLKVTEISDRDRSEARTLDWFKGVKW